MKHRFLSLLLASVLLLTLCVTGAASEEPAGDRP